MRRALSTCADRVFQNNLLRARSFSCREVFGGAAPGMGQPGVGTVIPLADRESRLLVLTRPGRPTRGGLEWEPTGLQHRTLPSPLCAPERRPGAPAGVCVLQQRAALTQVLV